MATETELKLLLETLDDYAVVLRALQGMACAEVRESRQVNYYLDTVDRSLLRQHAMVRVRVADGAALLTVKVKPRLQGGVIEVAEHERSLDPDHAAAWLATPPSRTGLAFDVAGWLGAGGVLAQPLPAEAQLQVLGAMHNTRRKVPVDGARWGLAAGERVVAELDRAHYGAGGAEAERFELEIEHVQAATMQPAVEAWLAGLDVAFRRAEETKYAQFLRLAERHAGWGALA
ncbi:MAG: CYTH domain-containing protein [Deltaproteobacteria bacterium]|nr:CYTH domain-containing protein [Deltaproteobacteria bacterium]